MSWETRGCDRNRSRFEKNRPKFEDHYLHATCDMRSSISTHFQSGVCSYIPLKRWRSYARNNTNYCAIFRPHAEAKEEFAQSVEELLVADTSGASNLNVGRLRMRGGRNGRACWQPCHKAKSKSQRWCCCGRTSATFQRWPLRRIENCRI